MKSCRVLVYVFILCFVVASCVSAQERNVKFLVDFEGLLLYGKTVDGSYPALVGSTRNSRFLPRAYCSPDSQGLVKVQVADSAALLLETDEGFAGVIKVLPEKKPLDQCQVRWNWRISGRPANENNDSSAQLLFVLNRTKREALHRVVSFVAKASDIEVGEADKQESKKWESRHPAGTPLEKQPPIEVREIWLKAEADQDLPQCQKLDEAFEQFWSMEEVSGRMVVAVIVMADSNSGGGKTSAVVKDITLEWTE